ncbi:MAG: STAS domain-containing protein [Christensenellales bacterium]|jgi:stage II sporulation protein AA (anti-sigma F factor antagonist)
MQIKASPKAPELTVALRGELDHHCAATVRDKLDALIMDPQIKVLTLDLKHLTFMDSSGIGVIIGRYKHLKGRGGRMQVKNVNAQIDRIMTLAGLYRIVKRVDTPRKTVRGRQSHAR